MVTAKLLHNDTEIQLSLIRLEPKCPLCRVSITYFHCPPYCYFTWYNSLYHEAHLNTSSHLILFQTYTCNRQNHCFIDRETEILFPIAEFLSWPYFTTSAQITLQLKGGNSLVGPSYKDESLIFVSISASEALTHRKKQWTQISPSPLQDPGFPLIFWRKAKRRSRHRSSCMQCTRN